MARAAVETLARVGSGAGRRTRRRARGGPAPHPRLRVVARRSPRARARARSPPRKRWREPRPAGRAPTTRSGCCSPAAPPACSRAPVAGLTPAELTALYGLLLGSGLDITAMNRIRKRFSRWGGGRLARGARAGAGPGVRRLRRHRRRPRLDRLRALRPRPHHRGGGPPPARAAPGSGTAFPAAARRLAAGVGIGGNSRNAKARRSGLRAGDPRADRQ